MSRVGTWKAIALGAACGIASLAVARALILPVYVLATTGSLNPMVAVAAPAAIALTYVNLSFGLLCAGLGGYVTGRFSQTDIVFHGTLAGVGIALVNHGSLVLWQELRLGTIALVLLTVAFGTLGGYIAKRMKSHQEVSGADTSNL